MDPHLRVLRHVGVGPQVGLGLEPHGLGPLLSHDEAGGGAVRQVGGVGRRHSSVRLHEGGLQLRHLLLGGDANPVVRRDEILGLRHLDRHQVREVALVPAQA